MKRALPLLALTALLAVGSGCARPERLSEGRVRVEPAAGATVVVDDDGAAMRTVTGTETLDTGTRLRVTAGRATVTLAGGDRLELAEGANLRLSDPPSLLSGRVVVVPGSTRPVPVEVAGTRVTALGPARLDRDLAVTAASYRTGLRLDSAGRRLRVPPLRQATVAALGELPSQVDPIAYDAGDPFDREYLAGAADLGAELDARSRGLTASLARGEGRTPGFFRLLLPELENEPAFGVGSLAPGRDAGETLVGIAIALRGSGGTFATRVQEVFAFRDAGADWGLVALDQGVDEIPQVVSTVDQAIGRAPLAFAPPPSTRPASGPPVQAPEPAAPPPTSPPPAAPVTTTPPPVTVPPPVVPGPVAPPVTQPPLLAPITDLLVGLLPGLIATGP